jgi:hypothetical protein
MHKQNSDLISSLQNNVQKTNTQACVHQNKNITSATQT